MAGGTGQSQTPMGGGSSPLNTGGGMSGGQTQMPNFAAPQQQPPEPNDVVGHFGDMQYRPQQQPMQQPTQQGQSIPSVFTPEQFKPYANAPRTREETYRRALEAGHIGNPGYRYLRQQPPPMQNPFQPQQPSFMQDPEFQGYQTQAQDLQRQMDEYMRKAPMYQQLQELQGKMAPFHQRYQQQEMQRMQQMQQYQQPSPFRRGQFQQPMGLQGLMGMLGGRGGMAQRGSYEQYVDNNNRALASASQEVKQPTLSRADFEAREQQLMSRLQPRMSMDMPQPYFYKNGGKV